MSLKFIKNKEDFTCEKCGTFNMGDGYTNHCFSCLWSKHVDNFPGDRAQKCGGLMRPVSIKIRENTYILRHKCEVCGLEKNNKTTKNDVLDNFLNQKTY